MRRPPEKSGLGTALSARYQDRWWSALSPRSRLACPVPPLGPAALTPLRVNHVLSSRLLTSSIFADLIDRATAAAPPGRLVTRSCRPQRGADVWHYHRPNLERRLLQPAVTTMHHDPDDERAWLRLEYFLPRYREALIVHCLNTRQASVLAEHGITNTRVIPHGVDRNVFPVPERPRQMSGSRLRLGIFSRRYANGVKGERIFGALMAHLDPDRIAFVFVGRGRWRDARMARARGFEARHWGRPPYPLMARIYSSIDALLILSPFEGGPASLPEALGSGVPVLSTPVGMCRDLVQDGRNGLLLTGRPGIDGDRIMGLLDGNGRGLADLNNAAFGSAADIPAWEAAMAQWHELYTAAVEARR
jgi:glycosyltransferase involved in cell wall biosynthesis